MTETQIRNILARECQKAGNNKAWALQHGLTGAYIGDVLHGRREPGKSILDALGYEKVVSYRKTPSS